MGRYIERGPISLEKLNVHDDIVTYTIDDGAAHEFEVLEFLALPATHITEPYESLTRYYGFWSCRARGERRKHQTVASPQKLDEPPARVSSSWTARIKRIYEINPLECPRCQGTMRIIAFVQDIREVKKIMASLGLQDFKPPPPLPTGPPLEHTQPPWGDPSTDL